MIKPFNITPPPKELANREAVREATRHDLIAFGKVFLSGDFKRSATPAFHYEVGDAYLDTNTTKQLACILPRSSAKTTLTKAYILHSFLFHNPKDRPLFVGWIADSMPKAYNNIAYIAKNLEFNKRIISHFGDQCGRHYGKKWNEKYLSLTNGCVLVSRSNLVGIRGESLASDLGSAERFFRVILDDIENEENTKTYEARDGLKRVITNAIHGALDPKQGRLIFNGTPVHHDSFCQNILDGYKKAEKEGTADDYSWMVIHHKSTQPQLPGGVLWHSYMPREKLDEKKKFYIDSGNPNGYYQEFELEPQGLESRIWTTDNYHLHKAHYYFDKNTGMSMLEWNGDKIPINCFIGCDPATDILTKRSDDSVILVIAVDNTNRIFVLDYVAKRGLPQSGLRDWTGNLMDPDNKGVVDYIIELYDMYHCMHATIEDVGMTRGVWQDLDKLKTILRRPDIVSIPEEPSGREKLNKIKTGLNPLFSYKQIYVREEHYELREQIEQFGPLMTHDDIIESLYFATRNIYTPKDINKDKRVGGRVVSGRSRSWIVR